MTGKFRDLTTIAHSCPPRPLSTAPMSKFDPWDYAPRHPPPDIVWHPLPSLQGIYAPAESLIILNPAGTKRDHDQTLTHELGHHELGHWPVTNEMETARMELRAKRWAAQRLVSVEDIVEAVKETPFMSEIAEILEVDPDLLATRVDLMTNEERQLLEATLAEWG